MPAVYQFLTTLCCSLFAGAALYVSLVEHPARMECGTQVAVTEFSPSYRRAAVMQALLAVLGFLFSLIAWLQGSDIRWLVGGVLFISVVPFTLIVIMPTNKALMDASLDKIDEPPRLRHCELAHVSQGGGGRWQRHVWERFRGPFGKWRSNG